jgi:NAD(P)-dependent dehydrogenase (short-subunit alcohol dehydrogenase family)
VRWGARHARLFVEEGAKVVVGDVNSAESERLAAELTDDAYQRPVEVDEHGVGLHRSQIRGPGYENVAAVRYAQYGIQRR